MSFIQTMRKWVWLDPGTILNVDHRLANQDIVCWFLH